ncbi:hypothetical protein [Asticcacaulis solisilvae]|uniref:hypothetical protein n=1 Tax=Asticcacaulis solisilvae TaxID=1217274 RepID=UPI003FD76E4C
MRVPGFRGLAAGGLAALACAVTAGPLSASSDYFPSTFFSLSEGNTYSLFQPSTAMAVPFLAPANDSRVNLLLLLADARGVRPHFLSGPTPFGRHGRYVAQTPIDFRTLTAVFDTARPRHVSAPDDTSGSIMDGQGDRCRSNAASGAAYVAALKSSAATPAEKRLLATARAALAAACVSGAKPAPFSSPNGAVTSAPGHDFATYLAGASAFYSGDFAAARTALTAVTASAQPWLREAALYTVARVDLNAAEAGIDGPYGEVSLANVDVFALARAEGGFQTYLHDYPRGAYAASARGFQRRVLWLRGDKAGLADLYEKTFDDKAAAGNVSMIALAYEIDNVLLGDARPGDIRTERLRAVMDLIGMRTETGKPAALTRADLEAQAPLFATQPELYAYLRAAYSLYVENRPADALKALDGLKAAPRMSTVRFSGLVLKGLALEALHQPAAARAHWLALVARTEPVLQRPAVELALAQTYEKSGEVAAVFAKGSPIHDPTYREILLSHSASPDLLRARAMAPDTPVHERQLALYVLLYKELTRGRYQAFTGDWQLMPDPAPPRTHGDKLQIGLNNPPALTDFAHFGGAHDGYTCPGIATVAAALAASARDEASLICLGEFIRIYGYDTYGYDGYEYNSFLRQDNPPSKPGAPPQPAELGTVAAQFPGIGISRFDIYKTIIKDRNAAADVRAYALYRMVRCWAPSGANHCDETDVPLDQRRQWFVELKARYPSTPWAKKLKVYW